MNADELIKAALCEEGQRFEVHHNGKLIGHVHNLKKRVINRSRTKYNSINRWHAEAHGWEPYSHMPGEKMVTQHAVTRRQAEDELLQQYKAVHRLSESGDSHAHQAMRAMQTHLSTMGGKLAVPEVLWRYLRTGKAGQHTFPTPKDIELHTRRAPSWRPKTAYENERVRGKYHYEDGSTLEVHRPDPKGHTKFTARVPGEVNESPVKIDNKEGLGSVPYNTNVNYMGFTVHMKPKDFLQLNPHRDRPAQHVVDHMKAGGAVGTPFLMAQWSDEGKHWQVYQHEGRGRMQAAHELFPDEEVPVQVFPRGDGQELRARHLTPEHLFAPIKSDEKRGAGRFTFQPQRVIHDGKEKTR